MKKYKRANLKLADPNLSNHSRKIKELNDRILTTHLSDKSESKATKELRELTKKISKWLL